MNLNHVHPDCHDFVYTIEELLTRRQQELAQDALTPSWDYDEWGPRTWNRTEMEDMVYSSYKQMRRGRITRPPRREIVMQIADYLNCTLEERNRLLISAEIAPVDPYLTGEALESCLQPTIAIAATIELPAMVINRDWHIHFLNDPILAMYDVTLEQLQAIPSHKQNALRLLFDPHLPLYPNLIGNTASWTRMVRQTIYGFKSANRLSQFEPWYQELIQQWMQLPMFEPHWSNVRTDIPFEQDFSAMSSSSVIAVDTAVPAIHANSPRIWMRPLVISPGYFQFDFPKIIAFMPANDEARLVLSEAGLVNGV
jgi:hypothetical protein